MKRFKNILVYATAATEHDPALEHAERLAKQNNATVTIVDVLVEVPGVVMGNTAERVLRQVRCTVLSLKPDTYVSPVTLDS